LEELSLVYAFSVGSGVVPVTYNVYNRYIKYVLNLIGLDNKLYSSHSFRATLDFSSKVPSELIQIHGDWASDLFQQERLHEYTC
jgi:lipase chaperone LimK